MVNTLTKNRQMHIQSNTALDKAKRDALLTGYLLPGMMIDEVKGCIGSSNFISIDPSEEVFLRYRNPGHGGIVQIYFQGDNLYKVCTMLYTEGLFTQSAPKCLLKSAPFQVISW